MDVSFSGGASRLPLIPRELHRTLRLHKMAPEPLGITVDVSSSWVLVTSLAPEGVVQRQQADQSDDFQHLQPGDVIMSVDGESLVAATSGQARAALERAAHTTGPVSVVFVPRADAEVFRQNTALLQQHTRSEDKLVSSNHQPREGPDSVLPRSETAPVFPSSTPFSRANGVLNSEGGPTVISVQHSRAGSSGTEERSGGNSKVSDPTITTCQNESEEGPFTITFRNVSEKPLSRSHSGQHRQEEVTLGSALPQSCDVVDHLPPSAGGVGSPTPASGGSPQPSSMELDEAANGDEATASQAVAKHWGPERVVQAPSLPLHGSERLISGTETPTTATTDIFFSGGASRLPLLPRELHRTLRLHKTAPEPFGITVDVSSSWVLLTSLAPEGVVQRQQADQSDFQHLQPGDVIMSVAGESLVAATSGQARAALERAAHTTGPVSVVFVPRADAEVFRQNTAALQQHTRMSSLEESFRELVASHEVTKEKLKSQCEEFKKLRNLLVIVSSVVIVCNSCRDGVGAVVLQKLSEATNAIQGSKSLPPITGEADGEAPRTSPHSAYSSPQTTDESFHQQSPPHRPITNEGAGEATRTSPYSEVSCPPVIVDEKADDVLVTIDPFRKPICRLLPPRSIQRTPPPVNIRSPSSSPSSRRSPRTPSPRNQTTSSISPRDQRPHRLRPSSTSPRSTISIVEVALNPKPPKRRRTTRKNKCCVNDKTKDIHPSAPCGLVLRYSTHREESTAE